MLTTGLFTGAGIDGVYSSEAFAQRAVTVINQHADAHTTEDGGTAPLFLFMPFTVPHTPLQAPSVRQMPMRSRFESAVQTIFENVCINVAAIQL